MYVYIAPLNIILADFSSAPYFGAARRHSVGRVDFDPPMTTVHIPLYISLCSFCVEYECHPLPMTLCGISDAERPHVAAVAAEPLLLRLKSHFLTQTGLEASNYLSCTS